MSKKFLVTELNNYKMGFLLEDQKVMDIKVYEEQTQLSDIFVGRVANVVHNISAVFVEISKDETCHLSLEEFGEKRPRIGDLLLVQIVKEGIKTKLAGVTTKLTLSGEYVVLKLDGTIGVSNQIKNAGERDALKKVLREQLQVATERIKGKFSSWKDFDFDGFCFGLIARTKASTASEDIISNEIEALLTKMYEIIRLGQYRKEFSCLYKANPRYLMDMARYNSFPEIEVVTDLPAVKEQYDSIHMNAEEKSVVLYEDTYSIIDLYNLKSQIDKALNRKVYLKSGAYLIIDYTEAMTVIDVNSGKQIKGSDVALMQYKINEEAAREIARQLRIRNLSGIILVDFISMESQMKEQELLNYLRKETESDPVLTSVVDMTRLGLVEITRKKIQRPLHEIF